MRRTCLGPQQFPGGLAQQGAGLARRVDTTQQYLPPTHQSLWDVEGGSLCDSQELTSSQILCQILPPSNGRFRCSQLTVAPGPPICLSSDSSTPAGTLEDTTAKGKSHSGGPVVAMQALVLNDPASLSGTTADASGVVHHVTSILHPAPHRLRLTGWKLSGNSYYQLQQLQQLLLGLLSEVISTMLASRRDSTIRIYSYT